MDKIEAIVQRLPHFYAAYDNKSIMYGILKAFADEFDIVVNDYINRSDNDIGIMTTDERDLEWRWGALMGFPRLRNETYERPYAPCQYGQCPAWWYCSGNQICCRIDAGYRR